MPAALQTFLAAMTPIGELRLSIPLGITHFDLAWYYVLPLSIVGNMLPVLLLVPGLERLARVLEMSVKPLGKLLRWRAERLRRAQGARFQRYGSLALMVFVAVPLPFTGAWTGSLAAWAFQIPPRRAILMIALGVLLAGAIVTGLTLAGTQIALLLEPQD